MRLPFLQKFMPLRIDGEKFRAWAVLVFLGSAILWKGGKSLEATWILTGIAGLVVLWEAVSKREAVGGKQEAPLILWVPLMLFVLLTAVSYAASATRNYGLDEVLQTGALALLFLWVLRHCADERAGGAFGDRLVKTVAVATLAASGVGALVYVFQPVPRFVGTFFDPRFHTDYWPNAWAAYLLLAWPFVLFWAFRDFTYRSGSACGRIELIVRGAVVGLVAGALFLSYSRGGLIAFALQLLAWAGVIVRRDRGSATALRRAAKAAALAAAVAVIAFVSVNLVRSQYYGVQDVSEKVTFTAPERASSVSERAQFWTQALRLSRENPLLGWGPYSFRFVQPRLQGGVLATSDHPHNIFLKYLMERGLPAATLFAFLVIVILLPSGRSLFAGRADPPESPFALRTVAFISLLGMLLHSMIDFNAQFVSVAALFWVLLAVLASALAEISPPRVPFRVARITESALAILLLAVAFREGGFLVVSSLGRHAEARGDRERALVWYGRAAGEFFSRDLALSEARLLADAAGDAPSAARSQELLARAQQALDAYGAENAEDARVWKLRGDVALRAQELPVALVAYGKAYAIGKWNDLSAANGLIATYEAMGAAKAIDARRREFDALLDAYAEAIERNVHFIALGPNAPEFVTLANALARLYPDDAPRYQVMAARADYKARTERQRTLSRPPGFLW